MCLCASRTEQTYLDLKMKKTLKTRYSIFQRGGEGIPGTSHCMKVNPVLVGEV